MVRSRHERADDQQIEGAAHEIGASDGKLLLWMIYQIPTSMFLDLWNVNRLSRPPGGGDLWCLPAHHRMDAVVRPAGSQAAPSWRAAPRTPWTLGRSCDTDGRLRRHRSVRDVQAVGEAGELTGGDVLPGFCCPVRRLFPGAIHRDSSGAGVRVRPRITGQAPTTPPPTAVPENRSRGGR